VNCEANARQAEKGGKIGRNDRADWHRKIQRAVAACKITNQRCQQNTEKAAANLGASIGAL